ncbi:MAG: glycosyltransferase [Saprospiraceae bacterium]|nr:glycosyltransferase [Saprospiraceae bacterium]
MGAMFTMLALNPMKRKVVVTLHGLDVVFPVRLYQRYIIPGMFTYDAFICVSNATKEACIKRGFPMEKLHVVSNGVDGKREALTTFIR